MGTVKIPNAAFSAGNRKLASVIGHLLGTGRPDPENPQPPGPWDPYIRKAYDRTVLTFGPVLPDPWTQLNPQTLPPRVFFISAVVEEIINLVIVAQEIEIINHGETGSSSNHASYIRMIVEDWCGTMRLLLHRFPSIPVPPKPNWANPELSGLDLIVLGTEFQNASKLVADKQLQQTLIEGADKLVATGFEKLDIPLIHQADN